MEIKFKSFSSGSCGNCYFLGASSDGRSIDGGILIDAGVSPRRVKMYLENDGLSIDDFSGILLSHDHWDHIRSIGSYCKRLARPVWATPFLHRALSHHPGTGEYLPAHRALLQDGQWNEIVPGLVSVRSFEVPHDASQTVGFAILVAGHRYVHITDCGRITDEALQWCLQAETLVIESNYDADMLANGPYPPELQDRIRGGHGHLSNAECAEVLRKCRQDGLRNVFLCHLSEHNNTPALALQENRAALDGTAARVVALPRESPSPMFTL